MLIRKLESGDRYTVVTLPGDWSCAAPMESGRSEVGRRWMVTRDGLRGPGS